MPTPASNSLAPYWPLPIVWWGDHWTRDWAGFWSRIATFSDPAEIPQAEAGLGWSLFQDTLEAWATCAQIPLRVMSAFVDPTAPPPIEPPQ